MFFFDKVNAGGIQVFRVRDSRVISYEQMIGDLKKTNLVFIGEVHDRGSHHQLQHDIIKALNSSGVPIAVGFEMFTAESQNDLDKWSAGLLPLENFIQLYYSNWNYPWPLYKDIFLYVRDNKIPAVGLNVPAEISQKVARSGFSSLTKKELEKFPSEIACSVDERYMKFIRRAYAAHGHSGKEFIHFCEAQLLWDHAMAQNILSFLRKNPYKTVVVIAGTGHAWKRGIPDQVQFLSKEAAYRVILPEIPGYIGTANITADDADYILLQ